MAAPSLATTDEVVLVATDIVSSSALWEEHGMAFQRVIDLHDRLLIETLEECNGYAMRSEGDGLRAMFPLAADALRFCLTAQHKLGTASWPAPVRGGVAVRMGVHCASVPTERDVVGGRLDLRGLDVLRAEHLAEIAHGGQVLLSEAAALRVCASRPEDAGLRALGRWLLPGIDEPMTVYEAQTGHAQRFPPPRTVPAPLTNLEARQATLFGRDALVAQISQRLDRSPARIALTGPPGVGKSALAEHLALSSLGLRAPGVPVTPRAGAWIVSLEGVETEEGLATLTAEALGRSDAALGAEERVLHALSAMIAPMLVLDGADRLRPEAWELVSRWCAALPELAVVITRRAPPPIAGVDSVRVPPLALPTSGTPAAISASPAGAMFLDRARQTRPGMPIHELATALAINNILQWTGGLPLAIDLSASRLRVLGPTQLSARLPRQALELIAERATRPGEAPRSLAGVMESATEALTATEREALSWLSVFHGGFDDRAGEAMVQAALGDAAAPRLLEALRHHGLLQHNPGTGRWTMLPPIAAQARRLLGTREAAANAAHARIYAGLGRARRQGALREGIDGLGTQTLAADLDNLVEATLWATAAGEASTAFLARRAATEILLRRGPLAQAVDLNRAVRRLQGLNTRDQAELDWAEGWATALSSTPRDGLPLLDRSLATDHGDGELRARTLRTSGRVLGELGRVLEAIQAVDQALKLDERAERIPATALDRVAKADLLASLGDLEQANAELLMALDLLGDRAPRIQALALGSLAAVRRHTSPPPEALDLLGRALSLTQQLGEHRHRATLTGQLGGLLHGVGRHAEARDQLRRAVAQRRVVGLRRGAAEALIALGGVLTALNSFEEGRAALEEAAGVASGLGDDLLEGAACTAAASLEARAGDLVASTAWIRRGKAVQARAATPKPGARSAARR